MSATVDALSCHGRKLPAHWPFDNADDAAENAAIRAKAYAMLKVAHESWMAAYEMRRTDKDGAA